VRRNVRLITNAWREKRGDCRALLLLLLLLHLVPVSEHSKEVDGCTYWLSNGGDVTVSLDRPTLLPVAARKCAVILNFPRRIFDRGSFSVRSLICLILPLLEKGSQNRSTVMINLERCFHSLSPRALKNARPFLLLDVDYHCCLSVPEANVYTHASIMSAQTHDKKENASIHLCSFSTLVEQNRQRIRLLLRRRRQTEGRGMHDSRLLRL
jgi:hypothetical protein